jgi:hypothetical protein
MTHKVTLTKERSLTVPVLYRIHHHPPLVLHRLILLLDHFILRNLHSTLSYTLLRALSINIPLILVHVLTHNYNIVEYLAQAPCAMSMLEVLHHCPSQRRTLLATIGIFDLESSNHIMFNLDNYTSRLSHQPAFQVDVVVHNQQIHRTILDEGASTCVMSLSCWKGLKSPTLNKSPMMLHSFDGKGFHPHGILQSPPIQLGGKPVTVDVKVVDAPLDYNLLLGRSWFYAMTIVASSIFQCVQFPHQGKIVIVDQLDFCTTNARAPATNNIPFLGDHKITYESIVLAY